jgi:uncharacterized protein
MKLFFDTSALLKRYINESGSDSVENLFEKSKLIFVSSITHLECTSAFQRLLRSNTIDKDTCQRLSLNATLDFLFFQTIDFHSNVKDTSLRIIEKYPLKPLDTIQLASLTTVADQIDSFVVCDQQLKKYAIEEGFHVIDPTE